MNIQIQIKGRDVEAQFKFYESVLIWGFSSCISGFLFLAGWCWLMWGKIHTKVSSETLENYFKSMSESLEKIESALVGDFVNRGLITKHTDLEREIRSIKDNCTRLHQAER